MSDKFNNDPHHTPNEELLSTIQEHLASFDDTRHELSVLIPEIDELVLDDIFDDADIEEALAEIDFASQESSLLLDEDGSGIIEFEDLPGFLISEMDADEVAETPRVDPFTASGMFVLTPDLQEAAAAAAHSPSPPMIPATPHAAVSREPLTAEILLDDDDVMELDPLYMSGFELISDASDSTVVEPPRLPQPAAEVPPPLNLPELTAVRQQLRVGLDALGGRIELGEPWGRWSAELRLETIEEPDARRRASYLSLFATMLRFHGPAGIRSARQLEAFSEPTLRLLRISMLLRLVDVLPEPPEVFLEALDELSSHEQYMQLPDVRERTSSLLIARLLHELLQTSTPHLLLEPLTHQSGVMSLAVQALFAHRRGDHLEASSFWMQCARHLDSPVSETLTTLAGYINRQRDADVVFEGELTQRTRPSSRLLLTHKQHAACAQGQHLREAELIEQLLELEHEEPTEEVAAHFDRLVTLRYALTRSSDDGSAWLAIEAAHAAAQAAPNRLYHWLVLERLAMALHDHELLIKALSQQIRLLDDPARRALVREQLARAITARDGAWTDEALAPLERALAENQETLPVILTLGHLMIAREDWSGVIKLRNEPSLRESPELAQGWRRADLLERERGDLREILSLYRSARHEHQDSIHLFFCVERTLAKLGQWRGLQNLFEATPSEHAALTEVLGVNGYELGAQSFAARMYLPENKRPLTDEVRGVLSSDDERLDEDLLWHVVAQLVPLQRTEEALALVERARHASSYATGASRARALLWFVYIKGWYLRDAEAIVAPLRELLELAQGHVLRRFVVHSLWRLNDLEFLASALLDREQEVARDAIFHALLPEHREQERTAAPELLAAEIAARAFNAPLVARCVARAQAEIERHAPDYLDDYAHYALRIVLQAHAWSQVASVFTEHASLRREYDAMVPLLLNVLRDEPADVQSMIEMTATSPFLRDALPALTLVETAWRRRDWPQLHAVLKLAIQGAPPMGDAGLTTLLSLLQVFTLEFGLGQHSSLLKFIRQWSDLGGEGAGEFEMFLMLSGWYRAARHTNFTTDVESVAALLRELFGASALALLDEEIAMLKQGSVADATRWYNERMTTVPALIASYLSVMATVRQAFAPASEVSVTVQAKGGQQGSYLVDLVNVFAGRVERDAARLDAIIRVTDHRPLYHALRDWTFIRAALAELELGRAPVDVLNRLGDAREELLNAPWLSDLEGLLARATGDFEFASGYLQAAVDYGGPARAAQSLTELTLLGGGEQDLRFLASQHDIAALCELEARAALTQRDWRPEANLEIEAAKLQQSLLQEPQHVALQHILEFLCALEPALLASPWAALHVIEDDLMRLAFTRDGLDTLSQVATRLDDSSSVSLHFRMLVAQQLLRHDAVDQAVALIPRESGDAMVSRAWEWFAYHLVPQDVDPRISTWRVRTWRGRAERAPSPLVSAEILYEVARLLELDGHAALAYELYSESHERSPEFLPSQVARARHLILKQDYEALARQWSVSLELLPEQSDEARGLAFRLAFIHERELTHVSGALHRALDFYVASLSDTPSDMAALTAITRLALRLDRFELAAEYIERLLPSCLDRSLKVAYHLQLADLYDHELALPDRALHHYMQAHGLDSSCYVALLGILRTDTVGEREHAVRALSDRLHAASSRESLRLSDHLLLLCSASPAAEHLMRTYFPEHVLWRMTQFVKYLEHGEIHEEALAVLAQFSSEPALSEVFVSLEHAFTSSSREHVKDHIFPVMRSRPSSEGLWLTLYAAAWEERNFEQLAKLIDYFVRNQTRSNLELATEMTRQAMVLSWMGDAPAALAACERALERVPDFLPAVKFAHLIATTIPNWQSTAHWCSREAELSRVPAIATRSHLEASEVQRRYLGDADAAINQLSIVLRQNPEHPEAFGRLKALLIDAHRIPEVLQLCSHQLSRETDSAARVELLNEMADLAVNHIPDQQVSIRYLSASIREQPRQLRRLRILAELYEATAQYPQALACYNAAARLSRDAHLNVRMVLQMAHILERHLMDHERAFGLYARVLEMDPHSVEALHGVARMRQGRADWAGALDTIRTLEQVVQTPEEMRKVRLLKLEVVERGDLPTQQIIDAALEVLLYHPEYLEAADILREELVSQGRDNEVELLFRDLVQRALREHASPPIKQLFSLARRLNLDDMAFSLSSVGCWLSLTSRDLLSFHEEVCTTRSTWPKEHIDAEFSAGVLPESLDVAFFEIIRRSSEGLIEACDPMPYSQLIKRRNRITQPLNPQQEMAKSWPALFGLNLRDVYYTDSLPMGSAIVWDDGVRLILDRQWDDPENLYRLLVRLGTQIAAWSMGVGYWSSLGREVQVMLFNELMSSSTHNWQQLGKTKLPAWLSQEKYSRWVTREGSDKITAYALELGSRLGARALPLQFLLIELTMERLATVVMPDIARALPHTVRLGVERGSAQRPWKYLLSSSATRIRQQIGVAIDRELIL